MLQGQWRLAALGLLPPRLSASGSPRSKRGNTGISHGYPPHRLSLARAGKGVHSFLSIIIFGTSGKIETDSFILQQYLFSAHVAPPFPLKTFYLVFPLKVIVNLSVSHQFYVDTNFLLFVLFWSDFLSLLTLGISNLWLLKSRRTQSSSSVLPPHWAGRFQGGWLLTQRSQHLLEQQPPWCRPRVWGTPSRELGPLQHRTCMSAKLELTIGVEKKNDRNSSILKELGWKPVSSNMVFSATNTSLNFKIQSKILGFLFNNFSQTFWKKRAGCQNISSGQQSGKSLESEIWIQIILVSVPLRIISGMSSVFLSKSPHP